MLKCFQQKKNGAVFEVAEVIPVMTNNYEDSIMKGVKVTCKLRSPGKIVSYKGFDVQKPICI